MSRDSRSQAWQAKQARIKAQKEKAAKTQGSQTPPKPPSLPSRLQSGLQSTLFWGSLSMVAAIVIAVVAAVIHDIRWILIFAWPFAVFAAWEFARNLSSKTSVVRTSTAVAGLILAALLYGLYVSLAPLDSKDKDGARVFIEPMNGEKSADGTYYMPVKITDVGTLAVNGHYFGFVQYGFPQRMDRAGEDRFIAQPYETLKKNRVTAKTICDSGTNLSPTTSIIFRNPEARLSEAQYQQMQSGNMFFYSGVIYVYCDDNSKLTNTLYVAERCTYYDANTRKHVNCIAHNFQKNIFHPK